MSQPLRSFIVVFLLLAVGIGILFLPRLMVREAPVPSRSSPEAVATAYPRTLEDGVGRMVELAHPPKRLISLAPSLTEIVFALEEGDRLVGRTRYCLWPPEAESVEIVGGLNDPQMEQLIALQPDLVLTSKLSTRGVVSQLENVGLKVAVFEHAGLEGLWQDMETLARMLGSEDRTSEVFASMRRRYDRLQDFSDSLSGEERVRVLLLLGIRGFYSAGQGSFAGAAIELAGGINVSAKSGVMWPQLSLESILDWDPQVILVAEDGGEEMNGSLLKTLESWREDPRWSRVSAIRDHRFKIMNHAIMTVPGPRILDAAEAIARELYPHRFTETRLQDE